MGNTFSCKICLRKRPTKKKFDNNKGCEHRFCKDCIAKYIISKIGDEVADVECPESGCAARIDPSSCALLISEPVYARWWELIRQFNDDLADANEASTMNPDVDVDFALLLASRKMQRCPKCKIFVERTWGCRYVRCRCGAEFCYKCGGLTHQHSHNTKGLCERKTKILFKK